MKKTILVFLTFFLCKTVFTQHIKISATQGIAYDGNKNNDSLFLSKSYNVSQLRVGYHYGKLGIISNITYINQQDTKDSLEKDVRIPEFVKLLNQSFSNVNTFCGALGLELCVPIIKRKAQLNIYGTIGASYSASNGVNFFDINTPAYTHTAKEKFTTCVQTGLSVNYKFTKHVAVKLQGEYCKYTLPYNAVDVRLPIGNFSGSQIKNLLVSSLGMQYTF
jgi:hypothetical protein